MDSNRAASAVPAVGPTVTATRGVLSLVQSQVVSISQLLDSWSPVSCVGCFRTMHCVTVLKSNTT